MTDQSGAEWVPVLSSYWQPARRLTQRFAGVDIPESEARIGHAAQVGLEAASLRLARNGVALAPDEFLDEPLTAALRTLGSLDRAVPVRAIELAIELVAVAASIRTHLDEKPLGANQVDEFLPQLMDFVNSWFHFPP
jgi:hypothetical protein